MAFKKKARRKEIKNTLSYDVNESNIVPLVIKNAVLVDKVTVQRDGIDYLNETIVP